MMIVANEFDEVVRRIYELRGSFIMDKHLRPNAVYLGTNEWHIVVQANVSFINFHFVKEPTIFGLSIYRVINDSHISLGYVYKDEEEET
jgi:hypothetical protein